MTETEHLLTCLAEECSEVAQAASKALRFGLDDTYVAGKTPAQAIAEEYVHIRVIMSMLVDRGVVDFMAVPKGTAAAKRQRVLKYMQYARERHTLS